MKKTVISDTVVFLCSGGGGNLRFVYHAIQHHWVSSWSKIVVIADRECPALEFARKNNLENYILDFSGSEQEELLDIVSSIAPSLIITTVHRILSSNFVTLFKGRLLNLHYSLLPAFAGSIGVKPVSDALKFGVRLIGATVHTVTEIVDGGPPEVQVVLPVDRVDTVEYAMDISFRAGCYALLTALRIVDQPNLSFQIGGYIKIDDRPALINPIVEYPLELNEEVFWDSLRLESPKKNRL